MVRSEATSGGHAVDVRMRWQLLIPAMQYAEEADRSPHVKGDCTDKHTHYCYAAAVADGELASCNSFWSQLEPKSGGTTS